MGGFSFLPGGGLYPGEDVGGTSDLSERRRIEELYPEANPRPTFGHAFNPFDAPTDLPPTFGAGYNPPEDFSEPPTVAAGYNPEDERMPFDNSFTQARGSILGGIIGAIGGGLRGFVEGPTVSYPNIPGLPTVTVPIGGFPETTLTSGGCGISRRNSTDRWLQSNKPRCVVEGKGGRRRKGQWVIGQNGKLICCPTPRRMNPCNSRALNRAARRLQGFAKMEKRIHKALRKACGPVGRRIGMSRSRSKSKKCCA